MSDIEWYLSNWARYMRGGCSPEKLPKQSPSMTGLPNYVNDPDAQYDDADLTAAEATDSIIAHDLEPIEACAIHHAYLNAVFRFNRQDFPGLLLRAELKVQGVLSRKGLFVPRVIDTNEKQA